jgi:hypothetical protein
MLKDASNADLKKAFRKLSLTLHPDKNDAPDASEKFRQMVAVYEVLKDGEKRKRYDQVLREGLPNWRQPMFYFRRARKMGMGELAAFLSLFLTICHYLMCWGSYLEKCWVSALFFSGFFPCLTVLCCPWTMNGKIIHFFCLSIWGQLSFDKPGLTSSSMQLKNKKMFLL